MYFKYDYSLIKYITVGVSIEDLSEEIQEKINNISQIIISDSDDIKNINDFIKKVLDEKINKKRNWLLHHWNGEMRLLDLDEM